MRGDNRVDDQFVRGGSTLFEARSSADPGLSLRLLGGGTVPGFFFRSSVAVGPGHEPERGVVGPLGALPEQGERGILGRSLGGK